jgi:hypothetical protein
MGARLFHTLFVPALIIRFCITLKPSLPCLGYPSLIYTSAFLYFYLPFKPGIGLLTHYRNISNTFPISSQLFHFNRHLYFSMAAISGLSASVTRILYLTGFPKELKTKDIQSAFSEYENNNGGFKIKWKDDTSLLIVFQDAAVGKSFDLLSSTNNCISHLSISLTFLLRA